MALTYSWDINGDGVFGDAAGATPTLTWPQLQALGIDDGPASYQVRVRVTNTVGDVGVSPPVALTVTDVPPTVAISGNAAVAENTPYTLTLSAVDPGDDPVTGWEITWAPGVAQTINGSPASVQHTYAVEGDYTITAVATNEDGTFGSNSLPVMVGVPPTVVASTFEFEQSHGIAVRFSESVQATLSISDIFLANLTQGFQVNPGSISLAYNTADNTATLAFPGLPSARLQDGNYRLTISAAGVTDAAGRLLDGDGNGTPGDDYLFEFFVFAGDANRDRTVDLGDFALLAANFNRPGTFSQGDFNYSGTVELGDFSILASRMNQSLPPAALARHSATPVRHAALPAARAWTSWTGARFSEEVIEDVLASPVPGLM